MVYSKSHYWQQFWRKIRKIAFCKIFQKYLSPPQIIPSKQS